MRERLKINKITIGLTLEPVEELSVGAKSLFRVLVLIIKALVSCKPKKKAPKRNEEPKEESTLAELEEENAKLKAELEKIKKVNKETNKPSSKQPEWEPKGMAHYQ